MSKNEADDRYGPRRMDAETSEPVHAEQTREGTPSPPSGIGVESKWVRFSDTVEEFEVDGEDRRGPWEEAARDRHRFARRCSEVERVVARCLTPEHRLMIKTRLRGPDSPTQDLRREPEAAEVKRAAPGSSSLWC
ncbi:hypothetical protein Q5P01_016590 [Channa striata]|uniref:Protein DP71L n=1 Tax=Channa striata TaxID=64152 RepID=A0AA88SCM4_CHASR|nr:hypothetical protein Q5P01_016590 [Channa striata]